MEYIFGLYFVKIGNFFINFIFSVRNYKIVINYGGIFDYIVYGYFKFRCYFVLN